jgi:hypothetical protein
MALLQKWTDQELHLAVKAYLKMLKYERDKTPFKKSEINLELQGKIKRSRGSIEKRFQNISHVLNTHKLPYVTGYLPLSNVGPTNEEKIWKLIQQLQTP